MARSAAQCVLVVVLVGILASLPQVVAYGSNAPQQAHESARHRRSLLAATQQISQCDWISGEGCAVHPAYASYALNRSSEDVVAQYVASALACATATDKGLCESASYCFWDPAFSNGQQGCFLHDDAQLTLQLRCVQSQYQARLGKLQACMAARHSCQCSASVGAAAGAGSAASCTQRQTQLLSGWAGGRDRVCRSLLGCWLSGLNSSSSAAAAAPDLVQLVETQLAVVQPKLELLGGAAPAINATSTTSSSGRRRALLQMPPTLSAPVLDDKSGANGEYLPESGSYGSGSGGAAATPAVGMNGVVTDDSAAAPGGSSSTPVENGNNVPGAKAQQGGGSGGNSSSGSELKLESSAALNSSDWALEQGSVDIDKLVGSSGSGSAAGAPAAGSGSGSSGTAGGSSGSSSGGAESGVGMTGGNAPPAFWQCAAAAAAKADTTRKWADVDYNSKALSLAVWARVLQPTALIDWGVQVLECFKTQVPGLPGLDTSAASSSGGTFNATKPNKESLEYAIVVLIRAFTAQADAFRGYLQAGSAPASGLAGLTRLASEVLPAHAADLAAKYDAASPAYGRDVMLQAAALLADMEWLASDVAALAASVGTASSSADAADAAAAAAAQQALFESYVRYTEESIRRTLYWLFHVAFDGPAAYLPGAGPSTAASAALVDAANSLAAAALPATALAADTGAGWQQLQRMTAAAAGSAATAAAAAGSRLEPAAALSNAVAGLALAHTQDLWGSRLELARAGAPAAARAVALANPAREPARWQPLRARQLALLAALQQHVVAQGSSAADSKDPASLALTATLQQLVAASGAYLLAGGSGSNSTQQQTQQQHAALEAALSQSQRLAQLVRQCYGSPAGLDPLPAAAAAAASVPADAAAACAELAAESDRLSAVGGGGVIGATLRADLDRQWRCNAAAPAMCASKPGCALALAPLLPPATTTSSSSSSSEAPKMVCQASDASLTVSSLDAASKASLAAGAACEQYLRLPACEAVAAAGACNSAAACRWEASGARNLLHTAPGANATKASSPRGTCSYDWVAVLRGTAGGAGYVASLSSMADTCASIAEQGSCEAQTMLITLDAPAPASASQARFWVPAIVAAAVVGSLLFGAAMWWRRRSTAARRAADEARAAAGGGRSGRRGGASGGKDGKAGKSGLKKKVKRAEPGQYKPDLMRDSFTDYMRAAPQQFENGVAIAKAAMATGSLDTAVVVADVAGGRALALQHGDGGAGSSSPSSSAGGAAGSSGGGAACTTDGGAAYDDAAMKQQQLGARAASGGRLLPPAGSAAYSVRVTAGGTSDGQGSSSNSSSSNLIDLGSSELSPGSHAHQQQQQHGIYSASGVQQGAAAGMWGSAAAASSGHLPPAGPPGGFASQQLQGGMSVPVNLLQLDPSLALTSSVSLVSSLPQHSSLPVSGLMMLPDAFTQQQQAAAAAAAARAGFGASTSLARISGSSSASAGSAPQQQQQQQGRSGSGIEPAHSGALLLPPPGPVAAPAGGAAAAGGSSSSRVPASEDGSILPTWSSAVSTDLLMQTQKSSALSDK